MRSYVETEKIENFTAKAMAFQAIEFMSVWDVYYLSFSNKYEEIVTNGHIITAAIEIYLHKAYTALFARLTVYKFIEQQTIAYE